MPKVTIIIAAYNAAPYLVATVVSVQNQSLHDWHLIIVNDGSTDRTGTLADQLSADDARIQVIHQTNHGVSYSRNQGINLLPNNTQFVGFLDADDTYHPHALEILTQALENSPDASAAYGAARFIDGEGKPYLVGQAEALSQQRREVRGRKLLMVPLDADTTFDMLVYRNCIWTPGQVLIRLGALKEVGTFDVEFGGVADWDMWIRLCSTSALVYVDTVVLDYRRHDSNMSSNDDKMREVELQMRRKHSRSKVFSALEHKTLLRGYKFSEREFARQRVRFAGQCLRQKRLLTSAKHLTHALILTIRSHINSVL